VSDFTVSNGVIHHTPDPKKSFAELARITRPGGYLYVCVYAKGYYWAAFNTIGPLFRLFRKMHLDWILKALILPPFYLFYSLAVMIKGRTLKLLPVKKVWSMFSDLFLTPQATFHFPREIRKWGEEVGLVPVDYGMRNFTMVFDYLFLKSTVPSTPNAKKR